MGFRQLLLLVPVAASLVNCQKYPGTDSGVFTSYDEGRNSSKAFHTVNIRENESIKCNEDKTQRCNLTTGWSGSSPIEEKSRWGDSIEEEASQCNQSEFSLHCSQEDECRSPGVCQHISCHYPHVAEFRFPLFPRPESKSTSGRCS